MDIPVAKFAVKDRVITRNGAGTVLQVKGPWPSKSTRTGFTFSYHVKVDTIRKPLDFFESELTKTFG